MYKKIIKPFDYKFNIKQSGFYSISISASCRSGAILGLFGGEDLRLEIDGIKLREIPAKDKPQYKDIPPAWNGTKLKGLFKTVIFILHLEQGGHIIKFIPYRGATTEKEPEIILIQDCNNIEFKMEEQAQDGNRRPWVAFVLIDLPLNYIDALVKCEKRFLDSDDVKLIIDGQTQKNKRSGQWGKNWYWQGRQLCGNTEEARFYPNLDRGTHYVEFWADRQPTLHWVKIDLRLKEENIPENDKIPTVDNPKWTGDFNDDTEQMILTRAIYGEARNEILSDKARIAVGWSIRNRAEDQRWGNTYKEVILEEAQYSAFRKDDDNRPYVEDPLHKNNPIDKRAWENCYKIAGQVILSEVNDPTDGANHYYDGSIDTPYWANNENFKIKIDSIYFHRL